jgi:hypothetical protein
MQMIFRSIEGFSGISVGGYNMRCADNTIFIAKSEKEQQEMVTTFVEKVPINVSA